MAEPAYEAAVAEYRWLRRETWDAESGNDDFIDRRPSLWQTLSSKSG